MSGGIDGIVLVPYMDLGQIMQEMPEGMTITLSSYRHVTRGREVRVDTRMDMRDLDQVISKVSYVLQHAERVGPSVVSRDYQNVVDQGINLRVEAMDDDRD